MGDNDRDIDLADVAIKPRPASHEAGGVPRVPTRFMGWEDAAVEAALPEAEPPIAFTNLLNNDELLWHFKTKAREKYAIADVDEILGVVDGAGGRRDIIVKWKESVPPSRRTQVRASDLRGGADRIQRFLARTAKDRVDATFYNANPTGRTRTNAAGQKELEVVWEIDGSMGWAREDAFL
jgi:hypothetical protein